MAYEPPSPGPRLVAPPGDEARAFALEVLTLPPHAGGTGVHAHPYGEGHYVISGTLAATLGERTVIVRAGSAVYVEPDVAHACWNPGASPVVVLLIQAPPPDRPGTP
ncbi:MAG TPA: cupin domain-containing protein [Chloroflexaceae bacterium]|nr:cupin domain-containing protein [Chloroflexaceae bacterium]